MDSLLCKSQWLKGLNGNFKHWWTFSHKEMAAGSHKTTFILSVFFIVINYKSALSEKMDVIGLVIRALSLICSYPRPKTYQSPLILCMSLLICDKCTLITKTAGNGWKKIYCLSCVIKSSVFSHRSASASRHTQEIWISIILKGSRQLLTAQSQCQVSPEWQCQNSAADLKKGRNI